ncbi:MAG: FAD-dependent oxidoreductase [Zavarzinia sp.]|nr:FAD-dependent oxidoreductase [Zavarzinia sp.]
MSPRIAIIGGGFTGTALAVHLARDGGQPLDIHLIEPAARPGGGVAYGLAGVEHRINVPATRMTVFAETPDDFARWMAATGRDKADAEGWSAPDDHYSRRLDFGAYMAALFDEAARRRPHGTTLAHHPTRALSVRPTPGGWSVALDDGTAITADIVALTASHAAPAFRWPLLDGAEQHGGVIRDPWAPSLATIPPDGTVFIAGTGLTMADTVVSLRRGGHRGRIIAVSRRALLPRAHGVFGADVTFPEPFPTDAIGTLRALRRLIADCEHAGLGWHPGVDAFRNALRRLWPGLPFEEQRRALRHLRAWWDVHRYRIAPQVDALLRTGRKDGWLRVTSGRIEDIRVANNGLAVRWTPRGGTTEDLPVAAFVNCTGPDADLSRSRNPLFRDLIGQGTARPDRHRLGLDIDRDGRVINADGRAHETLLVAGPLGRGHLGEVMGVPEASAHAREIAARIAALSLTPIAVNF